jgi:hypothetical protein
MEVGCVLVHLVLTRGDADIDSHVGGKVLIARYQSVTLPILEDNTPIFVQAKEVLDRCYDGVGSIVREDVDSHWEATLLLR